LDSGLKRTSSQPVSTNNCFRLKPEFPFLKEPEGSLFWPEVLHDDLMRLAVFPSQSSPVLPGLKAFSTQYCTTSCRVLRVTAFAKVICCHRGESGQAFKLLQAVGGPVNYPLDNINKMKSVLVPGDVLSCLSFVVWLLLNITYLVKHPSRKQCFL